MDDRANDGSQNGSSNGDQSNDSPDPPSASPAITVFNIDEQAGDASVTPSDEEPISEAEIVVDTVEEAVQNRDEEDQVSRTVESDEELVAVARIFEELEEHKYENQDTELYGIHIEHADNYVLLKGNGFDPNEVLEKTR
jgi:hypothetical protein